MSYSNCIKAFEERQGRAIEICIIAPRFGILELRNQVMKPITQNDVTLGVTNLKIL